MILSVGQKRPRRRQGAGKMGSLESCAPTVNIMQALKVIKIGKFLWLNPRCKAAYIVFSQIGACVNICIETG